tara:strand:+ start:1368 stop:1907 length:540 start_codon:yes stop_codon:yes gene_type:complete
MGKPREISNAAQVQHVALEKRIKIEQTFANQAYANFKEVKFGITACCFTNFANAVLQKQLCDWLNLKSNKVVVATEDKGVFVEPLAKINVRDSIACPATPSNVCTVLDLGDLLADEGTFTRCFETAATVWTITHNLGKYPSVTIVDGDSVIVIGQVDYLSTNQVQITFSNPFAGCAFLN